MSADADYLYGDAVKMALDQGHISINDLMRRLRIGYGHAESLIEQMHALGVIEIVPSEHDTRLSNPVMKQHKAKQERSDEQ